MKVLPGHIKDEVLEVFYRNRTGKCNACGSKSVFIEMLIEDEKIFLLEKCTRPGCSCRKKPSRKFGGLFKYMIKDYVIQYLSIQNTAKNYFDIDNPTIEQMARAKFILDNGSVPKPNKSDMKRCINEMKDILDKMENAE